MDKIHEIDQKLWISRRKVNLRQLIQTRAPQLIANNVLLEDDVRHGDSHDEELGQQMEEFVRSSERDLKPYFLFNSTDDKFLIDNPNCILKTYRLQLEHAKKMISDRAYKVDYLLDLKTTRRELLMRRLAQMDRPSSDSSSSTPEPNADTGITAIIVVQTWPQPSKSAKVRLEKEILFRADQCLTDLRDQFKCQRDYGVPMDLSGNPEQAERIFRGELFKSAFFLVGDTFYNDMRDPNNSDLSTNIVDWASKEVMVVGDRGENLRTNRGIGPFKRVKMEDFKFDDLEFRLGCPYLYLHQGDCEHLFTISDIIYTRDNSKLRKTKFPFVTATAFGRKTDNLRCYMCRDRPPHWYTRNNDRLPVDPYFFCENCFYSFNYDSNKKKLGQFQAYLYTSAFDIPDSVVMAINK